MAIALHEHRLQEPSLLQSLRADLEAFSTELTDGYLLHSRSQTAATLVEIEELSRLVDHLQVLAVSAVVSQDIALLGESEPEHAAPAQDWNAAPFTTPSAPASASVSASGSASASAPESASGSASASASASASGSASASARTRQPLSIHRNTAEYLRAKLRISRSEANRRLRLAANITPASTGPGMAAEPKLPALAAASGSGSLSMRAATLICDAVERVRPVAEPHQLDAMEQHLTTQATESDEDTLRVLARRWENTLDQDGQEPTDKILRARQGVFLRGRRNGLHFLEIGATDEQFEHLTTVMNTTTNPRAGTVNGDGLLPVALGTVEITVYPARHAGR